MSGEPIYLGVDVAGQDNTWAAALSPGDNGPEVVYGPKKAKLQDLVNCCETENVVAATIDAQLTIALTEENGFRNSDDCLRDMIVERNGSLNWVASINFLAAVPIRGRMLADHLSPTVGTLLETHPRASLLFALGDEAYESVWKYKGGANREVRGITRRGFGRCGRSVSASLMKVPWITMGSSTRWSARPCLISTITNRTSFTGCATTRRRRSDAAHSTLRIPDNLKVENERRDN